MAVIKEKPEITESQAISAFSVWKTFFDEAELTIKRLRREEKEKAKESEAAFKQWSAPDKMEHLREYRRGFSQWSEALKARFECNHWQQQLALSKMVEIAERGIGKNMWEEIYKRAPKGSVLEKRAADEFLRETKALIKKKIGG